MLEARQKGANSVLLKPVGRRYFDDNGKRKDDHGENPGVVREVAKAQKVPLIDLHEQSWAMYSALGEAGTPRKSLNATAFDDIRGFLRPNMLSLTRCKQVLLEDFVIQNSPAWTIHPLLCENLTVRRVTVRNPWYGQNTDAIDVDSCRDGLIEGCTFDVGDDGLCIKSGRDAEGRRRGVPTENFIIRDCRAYHAHGGFVIGLEMSGGVRNLYVSNCTAMGTDVGLRFKTARGRGGMVENIFVDGIDMTDIAGEAVLFDMYYAAKAPGPMADGADLLLRVAGERSKDIRLTNTDTKKARRGVELGPKMAKKTVTVAAR